MSKLLNITLIIHYIIIHCYFFFISEIVACDSVGISFENVVCIALTFGMRDLKIESQYFFHMLDNDSRVFML